jgi:PAS domain S-box-containing protein
MSGLAQNAEDLDLSNAIERLGKETAPLQSVIDSVPSFLWTSLPDGSKEYLNKRWYDYTGLPLDQGNGWGWKVVVHPDDIDRLLREWLALVESREPGELETRIRRYHGEYRWFLIRVVPSWTAKAVSSGGPGRGDSSESAPARLVWSCSTMRYKSLPG